MVSTISIAIRSNKASLARNDLGRPSKFVASNIVKDLKLHLGCNVYFLGIYVVPFWASLEGGFARLLHRGL